MDHGRCYRRPWIDAMIARTGVGSDIVIVPWKAGWYDRWGETTFGRPRVGEVAHPWQAVTGQGHLMSSPTYAAGERFGWPVPPGVEADTKLGLGA